VPVPPLHDGIAAFLGMMYYLVPKQAGRPIYSYRLSIVHFWALISIYMWTGPHLPADVRIFDVAGARIDVVELALVAS
jgi:cbb3-type cytochrome oxidase subunit 1